MADDYENVCLVQHGDRHTELLGFFLSRFENAQIDLVHRDATQFSYVDYFQRATGIRFRRVLPEYDRRATYDLVVLLSSDEAPIFRITVRKRVRRVLETIGLEAFATRTSLALKRRRQQRDSDSRSNEGPRPAPYRTPLFANSRQTIALCHLASRETNECRNLALSPLLHPLPWLLPVFEGLPTRSANDRRPLISSVGVLEERYYQIIPALARAMPDVELRLFVREVSPECMELLADVPNVNVAVGETTDAMMTQLAASRFLLILDHPESRYRKDRMSGMVPLGFNLGLPMVMSRQLAALNDIKGGVVTYDDTPDADLVHRLAAIDSDAHRALVDETLTERDRLARVATHHLDSFLQA